MIFVCMLKKDVLFNIEEWNAKIESQEIPGVTGKFGLGVQNEEKAMASHSSTLAWKIPMDGGAWWAAVHGVAKSQHN